MSKSLQNQVKILNLISAACWWGLGWVCLIWQVVYGEWGEVVGGKEQRFVFLPRSNSYKERLLIIWSHRNPFTRLNKRYSLALLKGWASAEPLGVFYVPVEWGFYSRLGLKKNNRFTYPDLRNINLMFIFKGLVRINTLKEFQAVHFFNGARMTF